MRVGEVELDAPSRSQVGLALALVHRLEGGVVGDHAVAQGEALRGGHALADAAAAHDLRRSEELGLGGDVEGR